MCACGVTKSTSNYSLHFTVHYSGYIQLYIVQAKKQLTGNVYLILLYVWVLFTYKNIDFDLITFSSPPKHQYPYIHQTPFCVQVVAACMVLTSPSPCPPRDLSWAAGKKWMSAQSLDAFLKSLLAFDKDNVAATLVERVERDYLSQPTFSAEIIRGKSVAAAGLCAWVTNICKYFRIFQVRAGEGL